MRKNGGAKILLVIAATRRFPLARFWWAYLLAAPAYAVLHTLGMYVSRSALYPLKVIRDRLENTVPDTAFGRSSPAQALQVLMLLTVISPITINTTPVTRSGVESTA